MAANWNQYITISEFLLTKQTDISADKEMISRCVISRAYYATYCIIRDIAAQNRIFSISGKAEDHKYLRDTLKNHGFIDIASGLNQLRLKRDEADYNSNLEFTIDEARYCLEMAKKLCAKSASIC